MNPATKRHLMRGLLLLHLLGLVLIVGMRFAAIVVEHQTSGTNLVLLAFGRDLNSVLARNLALPGIILIVLSGIALTVLRYGRRPPIWVWIKICLTSLALFVATPLVAPSLRDARDWAHWSADHQTLAPQFQTSAAQASLVGLIVFALILLNIPVGIWKPALSRFHARHSSSTNVSSETPAAGQAAIAEKPRGDLAQ